LLIVFVHPHLRSCEKINHQGTKNTKQPVAFSGQLHCNHRFQLVLRPKLTTGSYRLLCALVPWWLIFSHVQSREHENLQSSAKWRILSSQEANMKTEAIAQVLGGRKVLGKAVKKPDELAKLVRKGLPANSLTALAEKLDLGSTVLSRKLGIPQRTLTRRLSQKSRLTAAESDRTVRLARVYANAVEMIGDEEKAVEWLRTPNRALGGERPLDQLDTDVGAREVEDILGRIAYGVYS
jgi:putative toxin-antitoxin system antitoxin component (TIGR02293 family)